MSAAATAAAFPAIGTTVSVMVTKASALERARAILAHELAALDMACSRFRSDSELACVNRAGGRPVVISPLLCDALDAALRAAELTEGDVDPTVGRALRAIGYDRDFAALQAPGRLKLAAVPGWRSVALERSTSTVRVAPGVELDLGATAKAFAADRAAALIHAELGHGTLVNLGGDIATAGPPPAGGWSVRVTDDHAAPLDAPGQTVSISSGGLATSSVTVRQWDAGRVHHIVDPRTGAPAEIVWRTVSVAAASCLDANIAATAAIVRGEAASLWLESIAVPARLVRPDGAVVRVGDWPCERV